MIKRVSFWLYIIFAILLFVVVMLANQSLQKSKHLVSVIESAQNINAYQPILPQDIKVVQIPEGAVGANTITSANAVINKYASENLPAGIPITTQMFYAQASTPTQMLGSLGQSGQVMVAIPVQSNDIASEVTVGNTIDIVDVSSKTSSVVSAKVLKVASPTLLYVLMNQSDYLSIVSNLGNLRIELPVGGE